MSEHFTLEHASKLLSDWLATKPEEVAAQKAALDYYGKYFALANIDHITQDGFRDFLVFKNNRHWAHIQRHPEIYADMERLRECLKILLDESEPVESRLDKIIPKNGPPFIKGLSRAVLTPIAALPADMDADDGVPLPPPSDKLSFPLEKYLQEFIVSNWNKTLLGQVLTIYSEDGEDATEYETGVGRIDILARDKKNGDWVVIELKKDKDSDRVVGQLMRYMGWVKKNKAAATERVRGIIITNIPDDRIRYAMCMNENISFYTYQVSFTLKEEAAM